MNRQEAQERYKGIEATCDDAGYVRMAALCNHLIAQLPAPDVEREELFGDLEALASEVLLGGDAKTVRSAIALLQQGVVPPSGWQLVPKEPTHEMFVAGHRECKKKTTGSQRRAYAVWYAMLEAAPQEPRSLDYEQDGRNG